MRTMKTVVVLAGLLAVSACSGMRGTIGDQKVCMNDYFLGVVSISEMVSPCSSEN